MENSTKTSCVLVSADAPMALAEAVAALDLQTDARVVIETDLILKVAIVP